MRTLQKKPAGQGGLLLMSLDSLDYLLLLLQRVDDPLFWDFFYPPDMEGTGRLMADGAGG